MYNNNVAVVHSIICKEREGYAKDNTTFMV